MTCICDWTKWESSTCTGQPIANIQLNVSAVTMWSGMPHTPVVKCTVCLLGLDSELEVIHDDVIVRTCDDFIMIIDSHI